jgi:2-dehydropantoate 2-reductase
MNIAAMAAGAVGGYFGARLAADGHDVFFIARGAHRDAIKANGLKIESVHGNLHLPKPNVTDDPKTVGPVDVVLFAVKLWDTEKAAELTRPLLGANTRVITVQNGVDAVERMAPILGREHVVGGVAYIATVIEQPGVIKHISQFATLHFGWPDKRPDAALDAFVKAGKAAKCDIDLSKAIEVERWEKFIFLTAMAGATASRRSSIGPIIGSEEGRTFYRALMEEARAVGKASGVDVPESYIEQRMTFLATKVDPSMKASMAHDLERGNRLELDWLNGTVAALGDKYGIDTPASDAVVAKLKDHRMGTARSYD